MICLNIWDGVFLILDDVSGILDLMYSIGTDELKIDTSGTSDTSGSMVWYGMGR